MTFVQVFHIVLWTVLDIIIVLAAFIAGWKFYDWVHKERKKNMD